MPGATRVVRRRFGRDSRKLETFLESLPLPDNDAVFNLYCRLCVDYERKAFLDGLQYSAELILELTEE